MQKSKVIFVRKKQIKRNFAGWILLFSLPIYSALSYAQISSLGLSPAANTTSDFVDSSLVRDSNIDQPLDLLNDFYPSIQVTIANHDNVRRRSDLDESDTRLTITPALAYRTNFGQHQFYAAYTGSFIFHDELGQEDVSANILNAQLGLDLGRRFDLNLFGRVAETFEERGASGSRTFNELLIGEDTGPDEISTDSFGFDLIYGRKISRFGATLGYDRNSTEFTNNLQGDNNLTGNRDRNSDSWHLDVSYLIGTRTTAFVRYQFTETDFDREFNSLDSDQDDYLIGLRWKPANSLSGAIGIGATERDFSDSTREDYEGERYYANLNYAFSPFSNLTFGASRNVEEPSDLESDFFISDLLGVNFDHSFTPLIGFNAHVKWIEDDFNSGREDEFFDWGVALNYNFRSWLTAEIFYSEVERDSNDAGFDFSDRLFGVTFRTDLRSILNRNNGGNELNSFKYPRAVR